MDRLPGLLCAALGASLLFAQQRTPSPLPPDPAVNLVRTRIFLTTSAATLDLAIDGATLANAVFTIRRGRPAIRLDVDRNTIRMIRNQPGSEVDVEIDTILAGVSRAAVVGWTVSSTGPASARLDIRNLNGPELAVDVFDLAGGVGRVTTSADLLLRSGPIGPVPPVDSRVVLAFFYPWWDLAGWSTSLFLDRPLQPYSTDSPADLVRVMTQARNAGIDALVVSWAGKDFDGGIDHRRMMACLAAAQSAGIKIATLFETTVANPRHEDSTADPDTVFRWLIDVVDTYASQSPYLRVGGRPVVFAYAAQRMSQAGWADALGRLRATGRDVLLIGEGINATRLGALDGLFYYPSNVYQGDEIRDFDRAQSLSVRTYHLLPSDSGRRRIWVATVSPGYDDRNILDGRVTRFTDREGGRYYNRQWQTAFDMRADWIVITSWNEWLENTEIEPSVRYGNLYLGLTKSWSTRFRRMHAVPRP